jgi:hypothetical protein
MFPAGKTDIGNQIAGSASATGTRACAEAVDRAIAALASEAELVLTFTTGDADPAASAREAYAAAGGARVAGMTGSGAIATNGVLESGCSAIAISSALPSGIGIAETGDSRRAGRDATARALAGLDDPIYAAVLLFVDSELGDQAEFVAGAYEAAGGTISLAGGAAGGAARARFADGRALSHGVVAVAIGSSMPIGVGVAHGCVPRGAPSIVTRSDGANVIQLDGRPAETVYLEKLGIDADRLDDAEFEELAMVHPLAEPELSGAVRPRYVRARASPGALVCATTIERNAAVEVCDQNEETIVDSARTAVEDALSQLAGPAEAALVFDCAARNACFPQPLAQREFEALAAGFGDTVPPLAGAYTRGEIARARGAKGDRNHSVVVTAFSSSD